MCEDVCSDRDEIDDQNVLTEKSQTYMLYHAVNIYSRTSLFPRQRTLPLVTAAAQAVDTEHCVAEILAIAASFIDHSQLGLV